MSCYPGIGGTPEQLQSRKQPDRLINRYIGLTTPAVLAECLPRNDRFVRHKVEGPHLGR